MLFTSCTKKKKSIIPLLGIAAGMEESSGSAPKTTDDGNTNLDESADVPTGENVANPSTGTKLVSIVPSTSTTGGSSGGSTFTISIVSTSTGSTTGGSSTSTGDNTSSSDNTLSTTTASAIEMSSPETEQITFLVQPPPESANNPSAPTGSLAGSTPTANIVTSEPEPFNFQTTRNVNLDGKITDADNAPLTNAIIIVRDTDDKILLQSLTDSTGHVSGTMTVRTADQYVYISVYGNNENTNAVEVPLSITLTDGTTQFVRNISTIGDIKIPISNYTPVQVVDSDGDGVPDILDAYPNDPTKTAKIRVPASGVNTIAYEDLFPNAGDADLEDYVVQYYNEEDLNAQGEIVEIRGSYQHLARGAGYRHELRIKLPESVSVKYSSTVTKFDGSAVNSGHSSGISEFTPDVAQLAAGLLILERSDYTLIGQNIGTSTFNPGYISKVKIEFNTPVKRSVIGNAPYDLYAFVVNTGQAVHLPGKYFIPNCPGSAPSRVSGEGKDCFIDSNGFPWTIIVPGNFRWGKGGSGYSFNIADKTPYPKFITWYESGGKVDNDWYKYPIADRIYPHSPTEPIPYLIAMNGDDSNLMAYLNGSNSKITLSALGLVLLSVIAGLLIRKRANS